MADPSLYTIGGTVQAHEGGLYLSRPADGELLRHCREAAFAYVLTPRQLGKSSLMIRTAERLIEEGIRPVVIDLTQIGTQLEAEAWHGDFLDLVAGQLMLSTDARQWWKSHSDAGLTLRLTRFFEEVVLQEVAEPIVIFVDEIDTTLSLPFTDDFFAAIRYLYVARSTNAALRRLSFVLIGVATPADLIQDPKRTPFNIGERVDLGDFTPTEAAPLADGLGLPADRRTEALGWILAWTGGHPYLTQRLCSVLAADPPRPWSEAAVDEVVARTFLGDQSERDNNLQFVRDMLTKRAPHPYGQEVLRTYRAVWRGRRPVADEEQNLVHAHLKLSGVVRRQGQALVVRNRIYREVFNAAWIQEHDPESFWKRYGPVLKWVIPLTASSAVVAVAMAGLWLEAEKQRQNAEELANLAQQSKTLALLSEQKATQALTREKQARQKEQRANAARLTALQTAQTQRQRAEEKTLLARQEQQRAEREKNDCPDPDPPRRNNRPPSPRYASRPPGCSICCPQRSRSTGWCWRSTPGIGAVQFPRHRAPVPPPSFTPCKAPGNPTSCRATAGRSGRWRSARMAAGSSRARLTTRCGSGTRRAARSSRSCRATAGRSCRWRSAGMAAGSSRARLTTRCGVGWVRRRAGWPWPASGSGSTPCCAIQERSPPLRNGSRWPGAPGRSASGLQVGTCQPADPLPPPGPPSRRAA